MPTYMEDPTRKVLTGTIVSYDEFKMMVEFETPSGVCDWSKRLSPENYDALLDKVGQKIFYDVVYDVKPDGEFAIFTECYRLTESKEKDADTDKGKGKEKDLETVNESPVKKKRGF